MSGTAMGRVFSVIPPEFHEGSYPVRLKGGEYQTMVDALILKYEDYETIATDEQQHEEDRVFAQGAMSEITGIIHSIQRAVGHAWVDTSEMYSEPTE